MYVIVLLDCFQNRRQEELNGEDWIHVILSEFGREVAQPQILVSPRISVSSF